jgi:hypothetical protein
MLFTCLLSAAAGDCDSMWSPTGRIVKGPYSYGAPECVFIWHAVIIDTSDQTGAEYGGGVHIDGAISRADIRDSWLERISGKSYGGALWSDAASTVYLRCCGYRCCARKFGNFAQFGGSAQLALYRRNATQCTIFQCAYSGSGPEQAERHGGAIATNTAPIFVTRTNFTACVCYYASAISIRRIRPFLTAPDKRALTSISGQMRLRNLFF